MTTTTGLYTSGAWIRKRKVILKRDNYLCVNCQRFGRTTEAKEVHHIYPIETNPELKLTNENLISLCKSCHNKMHNRIDNKITKLGKVFQKNIKKLYGSRDEFYLLLFAY